MIQKISELVSVQVIFDHKLHKVRPQQILWKNRPYPVTEVGLRHCVRDGKRLLHIFSLVCQSTFFRLSFDTENLTWTLEEVYCAN